MIRLDKLLADAGYGTRSELKKSIRDGAVMVNGEVIKKADTKIEEEKDIVSFRGERVFYEKFSYYLLHKPAGYVTAREDSRYPVVMDLLPENAPKNLSPVGRLDLDTEGLLLITNDGQLSHHLLSPAHHVDKIYYAVLDCPVPEAAVPLFSKGLDIGDEKPTLPSELEILPDDKDENGTTVYHARLLIREGRYHQVKRMFEAVGCNVTYLKRLSMGGLTLGNLPRGSVRKLTPEEIRNV